MNRSSAVLLVAVALSACASLAACSSSSTPVGFDTPDGATAPDGAPLGGDGGSSGGVDATLGDYDASNGDAAPRDGSLFSDATPDVTSDGCVPGDAGPPPFVQRCAAATNDECDGVTDTALTAMGISASLLNGATGNGFDDDCDGLVDEGCTCPGNGQTKDCYLVPASQIDPGTKAPVGWCTDNSKGSLDCAGGEFPKWSGTCRGAQPPYRHDVCATGDFNCDGLQENSDVQDCTCKVEPVQCPTAPVTYAPYPDPKNLPLIDGSQWILNPASRANATSWKWTVIGGDCDNVLPHPTYAIYPGKDSTAVSREGARQTVKYDANATPAEYVVAAGEPLVGLQAATGSGVAGAQIYPAFGLSGDYVVQGEWDLDGTHYVCTQKVQVRAPGIRAELCWDSVGGTPTNQDGNDIDLHMARLQGVTCGTHGWNNICAQGQTYEDCWYNSISGCRDTSGSPPGWGYADSALSACIGWSSKRSPPTVILGQTFGLGCTNPRLDKDNISCDRGVDDPTDGNFCGPENINLDNPSDGDAFVVGVNHYANHSGSSNAHPHVNVYCNGARVLSAGYNPVTGQLQYPLLKSPGDDVSGDWWTAGTVTAHVANGQITSCDVATIPAHHADPTRDGTPAQAPPNDIVGVCVDSKSNATPVPNQYNYTNHAFIEHNTLQGGTNGGLPPSPAAWCKH